MHPSTIKSTLLSYNNSFNKSFAKESINLFENFEKIYLKTNIVSSSDLKVIGKSNTYYKFLWGSDQIWDSYALYVDPIYYLRFTTKNKRITNAPSFGKSDVLQYNQRIIKNYLNGFNDISVREDTGAKIVKNLIGKEEKVVLDTTLMLDKKTGLA